LIGLPRVRMLFRRQDARRAANSGPVTLPRIVQGATLSLCGLLRMRFVLPMSLRVIT
jgi:hypothetical protein